MKPVSLSTSPRHGRTPMPTFVSDGLTLAYLDEGPRDGDPIVLVHGFGSNARVNWVTTGWVDLLVKAGFRVIALDNRGHGASEGPHDPARYHTRDCLAEDVRRLMDHLGIARADVMGYSKGAWITAHLACAHPDRLRSALLGGLAMAMVTGLGDKEEIVAALEAETDAEVTGKSGRAYRAFAKQTGSDLLALAACMRGSRQPVPADELRKLRLPVLISVGTRDEVAGSVADFAALIPGAEVADIPDRDHMMAVGDKTHKAGVLAFLARRP